MGLFDKKFCDICGEKIGLLGNRKLEDGNLCKDCAKKLSPFISNRRQQTIEEIRAHLAYREQNKQLLPSFRPTRTFGNDTKVYIDDNRGQFIVTRFTDWNSRNPDIIGLNQVMSCNSNIEERKEEIYRQTPDGKRESYNPRQYKYTYEFEISIQVNSPYFSEIKFDLSETRPDSRYSDLYRQYERQAFEIVSALNPGGAGSFGQQQFGQPQYGQPQQFGGQQFGQPQYGQPQQFGGFNQGNQFNQQQYNAQPQYSQQQFGQPQFGGQQQFGQPQYGQQQQFGQQFGAAGAMGAGAMGAGVAMGAAAMGAGGMGAAANASWQCSSCGAVNTGRFCMSCGSTQPTGNSVRCDKCGWIPADPNNIPRFCPQCGDPINAADIK